MTRIVLFLAGLIAALLATAAIAAGVYVVSAIGMPYKLLGAGLLVIAALLLWTVHLCQRRMEADTAD